MPLFCYTSIAFCHSERSDSVVEESCAAGTFDDNVICSKSRYARKILHFKTTYLVQNDNVKLFSIYSSVKLSEVETSLCFAQAYLLSRDPSTTLRVTSQLHYFCSSAPSERAGDHVASVAFASLLFANIN